MVEIPKINFKSSLSEEEYQKLEQERPVGRFFDPGDYDLKILSVARNITERNPNGVSAADPTWSVFCVTLGGIDTRTIKHYLLAPTVSDLFKSPTAKTKQAQFIMAKKFRDFMRGVGADPRKVDMAAFSDVLHRQTDSLTGIPVSVTIGYSGPHLERVLEPKGYVVVDRRGVPVEVLDGTIYPDVDSAKAAALSVNIKISGFPEVLRFKDRVEEMDEAEAF